MKRRIPRRSAGFTLIEVLLVLVILVILGSLAVGMFTGTQRKANVKAARSQIGLFEGRVGEYYLDTNGYPPDLEALRRDPGTTAKWAGPYIDKDVPLDPWDHPYQFIYPGRMRPESFDIWSFGPDGQDGTEDDIGNWTSGV